MNKTVSISIDNKKFDLEEEASSLLDQYFEAIKKHFAFHENKEEILSDIENSIAEKFLERLNKHKEVVTKKDVEEVIKSIGTVEDFKVFEESEGSMAKTQIETTPKKLYRDKDNKVLGGVALGLAVYFGIDPSLVRIFFVITTFFWGFGPLLYLALWIIVPEAKTTAQKIEMYGGQTALASIEKKVTSQSLAEKNETRQRIRKGIGIFLIVISCLTLLCVTLILISFIVLGMPTLFILFLYSISILPFLLLLYVGRNLWRDRKVSKAAIVLLVISSIFVLLFISMTMRPWTMFHHFQGPMGMGFDQAYPY